MAESFDLAVIGAGPGGYVAAIRAALLGLRVALVEKEPALGGTCLNVGCIPSKALLESSELFHEARQGLESHGIRTGPVELDLAKMMARKEQIVTDLTAGIGQLMKKHKIKVLPGRGVLEGPGRVRVEQGNGTAHDLRADHVILAMGSVPVELPDLSFDRERIVSSTEALSFDRVPDRLLVVGAGAIGLEVGSVWHRLGARVTVVELLPGILPFADRQLARVLERSLRKQGLELRFRTRVAAAEVRGNEVLVTVEDGQGRSESLACDKLLVAVGRRPLTRDAGLEQAGIRLDENGRIAVNERLETTVPSVYAIGDLVPGPMLAHKASEEGAAVAERIAGRPGQVNYGAIPNVVYTRPELAQVGLTEEEAKSQGIPYKVGRCYFKANGRARCMGREDGLVKILARADTDRLLGVHIVGPWASEIVSEAVLAIEFQGSAEDLARAVHAHPTLAEALKEAALATGTSA